MNRTIIINLILTAYFILAAMTGLKRGILHKGRWTLGIVFGFLAVPIISPLIETLLRKTPLAQMLAISIPVFADLSVYIFRMLVFSISLVIVKNTVYHLTDIELPKGIKLIDKTAGMLFSVLGVCSIIWIFEWMVNETSLTVFKNIQSILTTSNIYAIVAKNNLLYYFLSKLL